MINLTNFNLTMFTFAINILAIISSFMFILNITNFCTIGFAIKYLFTSYLNNINFISG